ncbi:hypothetical protein SISSUDRAFT_1038403 [Sistotremastrum suecicum HHB10207 ss-3]|uniref:Zn(2)-C6 fungal-type domain-containing protein n=1 Tax=Sistotremastrum suecicum HHB10207 ss-3 TaxID=1314776 RepID=A0A165WSL3_9AGAM|nr:hypothetical protein SISSUDRAFT_1038403 [Sistotremastrum suecicum HHB10207 ss-3]
MNDVEIEESFQWVFSTVSVRAEPILLTNKITQDGHVKSPNHALKASRIPLTARTKAQRKDIYCICEFTTTTRPRPRPQPHPNPHCHPHPPRIHRASSAASASTPSPHPRIIISIDNGISESASASAANATSAAAIPSTPASALASPHPHPLSPRPLHPPPHPHPRPHHTYPHLNPTHRPPIYGHISPRQQRPLDRIPMNEIPAAKRSQVSKACDACQKAKKKCDEAKPCKRRNGSSKAVAPEAVREVSPPPEWSRFKINYAQPTADDLPPIRFPENSRAVSLTPIHQVIEEKDWTANVRCAPMIPALDC